MVALVLGAFGTQRAEGSGVVAALGREVASEAEHVRPGGQARVFEPGEFAEAQAFGDEPAGVFAGGQLGELVGGGDAAVEGAGTFGGLGGVLGDIGGDPGIGEFPLVVIGRVSCSRPQRSVRVGRPGAAGVSRWMASAAWAMAEVSRATVAQVGGAVEGPAEPSRRMAAWKWTTPRRWYSATLAKETRSCAARALLVSPAWRARALRRVMVKRRHNSGAQALNKTEPRVVAAVRAQRLAGPGIVTGVLVPAGHAPAMRQGTTTLWDRPASRLTAGSPGLRIFFNQGA